MLDQLDIHLLSMMGILNKLDILIDSCNNLLQYNWSYQDNMLEMLNKRLGFWKASSLGLIYLDNSCQGNSLMDILHWNLRIQFLMDTNHFVDIVDCNMCLDNTLKLDSSCRILENCILVCRG